MHRRDFMKTSAAVLGMAMLGRFNSNFGWAGAGSAYAAPVSGAVPSITLNNGLSMPQLGFGTWTLAENTIPSVREAVACGYRLFDTAQAYGNEKAVWQGIKESGIARKELFITTKISPPNMRKPPQKDAIDASIEALGGEYLDLFLLHWPVSSHIRETWETLEEYVQKGLIRSIGLSNFNPHHIEELLKYARVRPVLNQIEIHPYHSQETNVAATRGYGLAVEAWSPLAQGRIVNDDTIQGIAKKYGKSPAQVTLRWEIQRGLIVIPRSKNPAHIAENIRLFDFELSNEDMMAMNALNRNQRINPQNDPDNFPW